MHCPSANVYRKSNISNNRAEGWWMVQMIVRPPLERDFSNDMHWKHDELSNPEVGSSKNITGGLFTNSNAIDNRFFCPPERLIVLVSPASQRPSISNISFITIFLAVGVISFPSFKLAETCMASLTERCGRRQSSCMM